MQVAQGQNVPGESFLHFLLWIFVCYARMQRAIYHTSQSAVTIDQDAVKQNEALKDTTIYQGSLLMQCCRAPGSSGVQFYSAHMLLY